MDNENRTPLLWVCCQANNVDIASALLTHGADLNKTNKKNGACALHYAAKFSDKSMIEFLIGKGISVNVMDNDNQTPLLRACQKANNVDNVTALMRHGADFKQTDKEYGACALHFAAKFSDKSTIEFLIGKDISVNVMDNDNRTPLLWACQKANNVDNVTALLKHGADFSKTNKEYSAFALHYAAKFSDKAMIGFLIAEGIPANVMDNDNRTPLLWACCQANNIDNVTALLTHGADINKTNKEYGACALHYAAKFSDKSMIEFLIGIGISVNVMDNDNRTPLLWACCQANNIDNVTALLTHGADINKTNKEYGACALHYAAKFSDKSMIEFLIGKGISVNVMDNDNRTPLLWACQKANNVDNVTALLRHGADLNKTNKECGAYALHYAAKVSDKSMIVLLIGKGISVNVMDNDNRTPLLWACQKANNIDNVTALLRHKAVLNKTNKKYGACALHYAAIFSDKSVIEFLIREGISVNVMDNDKRTPLLWACQKANNVDNVTALLTHGADISTTNKECGAYALHYAAKVSDNSMIELLIGKGISVNVMDNDNRTPLLWACQKANNVDNVTALLTHGADINKTNKKNSAYALHYAAKFSDKSMIEFLIGKGISVNAMNNDNQTPLLSASCQANNVNNVSALLSHGADLNKTNKENGACSLHYAAKFSDKSMIEFLIEKGISVNVIDNDNQTPLLWACQKVNNVDNVTALLRHRADFNKTDKEYGACALHYAAKFSDKSMIEFFIKKGISVNVINSDNQTPLLWACCQANNINNVTALLKHGADINNTDKEYSACALHYAAKFSDKSMINFLIGKGISVNVMDNDNKTPLLWACQKANNIANVTALLRHKANVNKTNKESSACALHYAAKFSDKSLIEFLIGKGISVNVMDNDNRTPLLWACQKVNNVDNVTALLRLKADLKQTNKKNGACALHYAAKFSNKSMIEFLIGKGISVDAMNNDNQTPFFSACCQTNNVDNVTALLTHGADLNKTNKKNGACALHFAAKFSDKSMIDFLIRKGVSVNVMDNDNRTPLLWACCQANNVDNLTALLRNGVDHNQTNKKNGACALHYAAKFSDTSMIKFLIEKGISVNVMDNDNRTPLLWACQKANNVDNVTALLSHEADVSQTDKESGACVLHYAAKFSDKSMIEFLIGKGISVNVMDNDNRTPLLWACQKAYNVDNVTALLRHEADLNKTNKEYGACALHYAAKFSDKSVIEFLIGKGISVNVMDNKNLTPLLWACQKANNVDNVTALLRHRADFKKTDKGDGACALHYAAKFSDKSMIEFLIRKGIPVNVVDNINQTPLLSACCQTNNVDNVTALLKHRAVLNKTNKKSGACALHYAARYSDKGMIEFLIKKKISVNVMDNDNRTPLLWACQKVNNVDNVTALLRHEADLNKTNKEYGACALHYAAKFSDKSMIEFLIGKGISVNVMDNDNRTPLLWACQKANNVDNVTALLRHEADLNKTNKEYGACALHYAAKFSDKSMIEFLIRKGISVNVIDNDNQTPLLWACCQENNVDNVTALLTHTADINKTNKEYGACALHYAAKFSDKSMIEFLIEKGISVNVMDNDKQTPLLWACYQANNVDNVTVLLTHGADINKTNKECGAYALHYAAEFSDKSMIEFLIGKGISVNVMDNDNKTPLLWACQKANNVDNVTALLGHVADLNKTNKKYGACALHYAALFSDKSVIEFLIGKGISVNVMDNDNRTPLLWACQKANNVDNVTALLRLKADLHKTNKKNGACALHYAAKFSDKSMIEFLIRKDISVNVMDNDNKIPLLWACQKANNVDNVTALLRHKADINKTSNEYGACALHYAAKFSDKSTIDFLIEKGISMNVMDNDNRTPLLWACQKANNVDNVTALLTHGADINKTSNEYRAYALHYAAKFSDKSMIEFLIGKGISVNVMDNDDQAPLLWACKKANNVDNVTALLRHGADINKTSKKYGACSLHFAAQFSNKSMVDFLIAEGISVNVMDNDNKTPLLWACEKANNVENVSALLTHGADINKTNKECGTSALHYAAKFSDISMIEFLIGKGISVNVMDNHNQTPLLLACQRANNVDNVTALLRHGADISKTNKTNGACALHYAVKFSDKNVIDFLIVKGVSISAVDNNNLTPMQWALKEVSTKRIYDNIETLRDHLVKKPS